MERTPHETNPLHRTSSRDWPTPDEDGSRLWWARRARRTSLSRGDDRTT
jgi:hypothetical protein